jgi:hypothetical protein
MTAEASCAILVALALCRAVEGEVIQAFSWNMSGRVTSVNDPVGVDCFPLLFQPVRADAFGHFTKSSTVAHDYGDYAGFGSVEFLGEIMDFNYPLNGWSSHPQGTRALVSPTGATVVNRPTSRVLHNHPGQRQQARPTA